MPSSATTRPFSPVPTGAKPRLGRPGAVSPCVLTVSPCRAGDRSHDPPEVVQPLGDEAERSRRVVDHLDLPELVVGTATEVVGGARDVGAALLPHAPRRG